MKVLILVQSIEKEGYTELISTQKRTWDSVDNPETKTIFYYPDPVRDTFIGNDLYIRANPSYYIMFNLALEAIKRCLAYEWDYLFKTDNSAYICKSELVKTLKDKPRELYYGGQEYEGNKEHILWPFLWGEGVAMSRDVAEYIVYVCHDLFPPNWYGAEDIYFGKFLQKRLPWDNSLLIYQYWVAQELITKKHHVYRCRKDSVTHDFPETIKAMEHVHHVLNILN